LWSALAERREDVDLKVRGRGTIERRRDDPGTIEWDVAREGIVLFADPAAPAIAPSGRVREAGPPDRVPESVHEWVESAARNLRHCRLLWKTTEDHYWPEICWLSHQACEKYLKALLVSRYVRPPRTHKLEKLLATLRRAGVDLPGLDADCALLTGHAIRPRYPEGSKLGESDARVAFAAAERIVGAVEIRLPPRRQTP
jgi:HEPN domain-containing protein